MVAYNVVIWRLEVLLLVGEVLAVFANDIAILVKNLNRLSVFLVVLRFSFAVSQVFVWSLVPGFIYAAKFCGWGR